MLPLVQIDERAHVKSGKGVIPWGEPLLLVSIALGLIILVSVTGTIADPDLWGHLRFGHDVVAAKAIPPTDIYSFTSDRPWINHEWLAEVLMYTAFAAGGVAGLVAFKAFIALATLGVVLWSFRRFEPSPEAYCIVSVIAVVGILWRIETVRPQIFSLPLFALLLLILSEADRGRTRALIGLPVIMALWVNLHGGWLVGMGTTVVWLALSLLERNHDWRHRALLCGIGLGAGLATLANPYGVQMWTFLWETVGFARTDIVEWSPVSQIPLGAAVPWIVPITVAGFAIIRSRQPRRPRDLILVAMLALAAFRVSRLDAFLALAVVVMLAPELAQLWPTPRLKKLRPMSNRHAAIAVTAIAVAAIGLPAGNMTIQQLTCLRTNSLMPEPEAGRFIDANRLQGNLLSWFEWGEYVIWRFGPGLKVSIDGRRETVYSTAQLTGHYRFYRNEPDAQDFARAINADYIWLPKAVPIVSTLKRQGWQVAFEGPVSIVFSKPTGRLFEQGPPLMSPNRCFPGA